MREDHPGTLSRLTSVGEEFQNGNAVYSLFPFRSELHTALSPYSRNYGERKAGQNLRATTLRVVSLLLQLAGQLHRGVIPVTNSYKDSLTHLLELCDDKPTSLELYQDKTILQIGRFPEYCYQFQLFKLHVSLSPQAPGATLCFSR